MLSARLQSSGSPVSRTAVTTACGCGLSSGRSTRPRTTISDPPPAWLTEAVGSTSGGRKRRVIGSADVDAATVVHPSRPDVASRVEISAPLARRRFVSFHVDEEPGATDVADLLWYDVTELAAVRALLDQP